MTSITQGSFIQAMRAVSAAILLGLFSPPALAESTCPNTAWEASNGRTCANLGLNSNAGTCKGGYVTHCDDTRDSIRICRSNTTCAGSAERAGSFGGALGAVLPVPSAASKGSDYINYRGRQFHCTDWNFSKEQPCASGKRNPDCKGDCR